MKKLPKNLDNLVSKIHKSMWEIGEIKPIKLKVYDIVVNIAEKRGYEVSQHREYVDTYKFILKEEKK